MQRLSVRDIAVLAVLAAANSAIELTVGNFLHAINMPMKGALLVGFNLLVYALTYTVVPRLGAVTMVGFATAFVNLMLTGSFKLGALPAIVIEAAVIDLVLYKWGTGRVSLAIAGVGAGLVAVAWRVVRAYIILGETMLSSLRSLVGKSVGGMLQPLDLLALVIAMRLVVGVVFALLTYRVLVIVKPFAERYLGQKTSGGSAQSGE